MKHIIRKMFISAIVAIAPMAVSAQISEPEFLKTAQSLQDSYTQLLWSGKPKEAIASLEKYIQFLDTTTVCNSEHITEAVIKSEISNLKYDLACCLALSGQKKKALNALAESIDGGYSQYEHMLQDNDLAFLRKEKKFKQLAEIVAERSPFAKLQRSNKYAKEETNPLPAFEYQPKEVTCLPADPNDYECHVINTVWSETLQKWLYIDPTTDPEWFWAAPQ